MISRDRIRAIISGEGADRCGLWLGNPHPDSWPGLYDYFGTDNGEDIRRQLEDDFRWICPQFYEDVYCDPDGRPMFDAGLDVQDKSYPLADCESPADVKDYPWPDPDYLDFAPCIADLRDTEKAYRASGLWTSFYHNIMDLLGMENYMIKMHTAPEVVHAVTDRVCEFYY
ncbi:MAG: hypothetical protein ACOCSQ_03440 [Planctomycetota bacterium]